MVVDSGSDYVPDSAAEADLRMWCWSVVEFVRLDKAVSQVSSFAAIQRAS